MRYLVLHHDNILHVSVVALCPNLSRILCFDKLCRNSYPCAATLDVSPEQVINVVACQTVWPGPKASSHLLTDDFYSSSPREAHSNGVRKPKTKCFRCISDASKRQNHQPWLSIWRSTHINWRPLQVCTNLWLRLLDRIRDKPDPTLRKRPNNGLLFTFVVQCAPCGIDPGIDCGIRNDSTAPHTLN